MVLQDISRDVLVFFWCFNLWLWGRVHRCWIKEVIKVDLKTWIFMLHGQKLVLQLLSITVLHWSSFVHWAGPGHLCTYSRSWSVWVAGQHPSNNRFQCEGLPAACGVPTDHPSKCPMLFNLGDEMRTGDLNIVLPLTTRGKASSVWCYTSYFLLSWWMIGDQQPLRRDNCPLHARTCQPSAGRKSVCPHPASLGVMYGQPG